MRVKITKQTVHYEDASSALIKLEPDKRYSPLCHACGNVAANVHSHGYRRFIRDLNMASAQTWLHIEYLLLKNENNLKPDQHEHLRQVLELNSTLSTLYVLKDHLKLIFYYSDRDIVKNTLDDWCQMASQLDHPSVNAFVKRLRFFEYGILNHADYPIGTSQLEGANNKIKVIKRKAYGFHDLKYFTLKVKQAFAA
jgi:transposase